MWEVQQEQWMRGRCCAIRKGAVLGTIVGNSQVTFTSRSLFFWNATKSQRHVGLTTPISAHFEGRCDYRGDGVCTTLNFSFFCFQVLRLPDQLEKRHDWNIKTSLWNKKTLKTPRKLMFLSISRSVNNQKCFSMYINCNMLEINDAAEHCKHYLNCDWAFNWTTECVGWWW